MSYPSKSMSGAPIWPPLLIMCPLLVLADDATHAAAFAVAAVVVLVAANVGIFALRSFVPEHVRLPAFALVIGLFATTVVLVMQAFVFDVSDRVGLFAAIIAISCIDMAHMIRRSSQTWGRVSLDCAAVGLTFAAVLVALGAGRQFAAGALPPAVAAPAAFLIAGLSIAAKNALTRKT